MWPGGPAPDTVYVDDDYCPTCPNDGHTWGFDAFDNIDDALNAVANSTVNVNPGTYPPFSLDQTVTMNGA